MERTAQDIMHIEKSAIFVLIILHLFPNLIANNKKINSSYNKKKRPERSCRISTELMGEVCNKDTVLK